MPGEARLRRLDHIAGLGDSDSGPTGTARLTACIGAVLALVIAVALFSRFSIDDTLRRDEAIYVYGGQQLAKGVPFYVSIFDPKMPLSAFLAALGVVAAHTFGADEVHAVRIVFFLFACLAVAAVYLLGLWLWESPLAGIVGAVTFASFKGFALDALGGPDAKTPGILFAVLSMALLLRRRWFWGAFLGSLAGLVWQPLALYAAVAIFAALLTPNPDRRWNGCLPALAGAALPVAATTLYFWLAGSLDQFVEAAVRFPLEGIRRRHEGLVGRLERIVRVVDDDYSLIRVLFWGGLVFLVALLVVRLVQGRSDLRRALGDPFTSVVMATFLPLAAFSMDDFQGYPDVYPALPYAALGLGGAVGLTVRRIHSPRRRSATTAVALVAVAALTGLSWTSYSGDHPRGPGLPEQRTRAASIERLLGPGKGLYVLGDPMPLVLTDRRNPSRYVYLSSGVLRWAIHHTPGGLKGWKAQIRRWDPAIVLISKWRGRRARKIETWLSTTYDAGSLGDWLLYVKPALRRRAARSGIVVRRRTAPLHRPKSLLQ